jgi:FkbM family methyltransferase
MRLSRGDVGHAELAFTGIYEPEETEMISRIARDEGGLLVDVGANFGYYTLLWCGQRPDNRSIAFEASPLVLPRLKENIQRNRIEDRVRIVDAAASNTNGTASFDTGPADQTGWGGIAPREASQASVEVRAQRLDSALAGASVTLLKIDCEGAEAWVIEGASTLLAEKRIRHVCFEENKSRMSALGIAPNAAEQLLRSHGYQCEPLNPHPPFCEFHAWI